MKKELSAFPIGEKNDKFAKYFVGQSYLAPLTLEQIPTFNVTFEPSCRNNRHIHHAKTGGGQLLIVIAGEGWYQEEGKPARKLKVGDVVNIPAIDRATAMKFKTIETIRFILIRFFVLRDMRKR